VKQLNGLFIFILMTACSDRTGIPKDILPPDSMEVILKDVIMAEHYSYQYLSKDSLIRDKVKANQDLLEAIFKVHHITRATFRESLNYYESRPDLNKKIFDSLSAYANRRKVDLYAPKPLIKPLPVSVK
jgi:hypothetical protein